MPQRKSLFVTLFIIVAGFILFSAGAGRVHLFDWDELNFAESAREMLVTGDLLNVQINYEVFWEKPPLFIWLQALSMRLLGVNEFAARFPNAVAGVLTLLLLFFIGRGLKEERLGLLWAALYGSSFLPFFYFKSGIIDPWFNLFIFLGIYYMIRYTAPDHTGSRLRQAVASAFFLGLATLTKGPVGFLIFVLCLAVFLLYHRFRSGRFGLEIFRWKHLPLFLFVLALTGGLWFILQIANGNLHIIRDFIIYQIRLFRTQDAGHGGFPLYHFVILFFGVFPASIFAVFTFRKDILRREHNHNLQHLFRWMMIVLWVVLILFTIVRTKIVHYSSMCYFPITFLAAWYLTQWTKERVTLGKLPVLLLWIIAVPVALVASALPFIDTFKQRLIPYIHDEFAVHNLEASPSWIGFEWLFGIILIAGILLFTLFRKQNPRKAITCLLSACLLFIFCGQLFIAPQIETYSQAAAIEFYESRQGEECYIYPLHKSYAHYFYSRRQPQNRADDADFLKRGAIDKPAYFVLKQQGTEEADFVRETDRPVRLYEKNGFVFYVRLPGKLNFAIE